MNGNVLVFVESRPGRFHPAGLQCLTAARMLAEAGGCAAKQIIELLMRRTPRYTQCLC